MAVFLARIVMPRSRSSSFESRTRSTTGCPCRKMPLCRSMASTNVVLPWSTCAMIATLRIDEFNSTPPWSASREFEESSRLKASDQEPARPLLPRSVLPLCSVHLCLRVELLEVAEEGDEPGHCGGTVPLHACRL